LLVAYGVVLLERLVRLAGKGILYVALLLGAYVLYILFFWSPVLGRADFAAHCWWGIDCVQTDAIFVILTTVFVFWSFLFLLPKWVLSLQNEVDNSPSELKRKVFLTQFPKVCFGAVCFYWMVSLAVGFGYLLPGFPMFGLTFRVAVSGDIFPLFV